MNGQAPGGHEHRSDLRAGVVPRRGLVGRLLGVTPQTSVIVVDAPAGYGKTTLLRQWAAVDERSFGWVECDPEANEPVELVRRIARAVPADDGVEQELAFIRPALASNDPVEAGFTAELLIDGLRSGARPWVLVIDDAHTLTRPACQELLTSLAQVLPRGSHVVVAGQRPLGHGLSRLRRQGRSVELEANDLVFSAAEAKTVFDLMELPVSDATLAQLLEVTEGWPAGIYLAALAAGAGGGRTPGLEAFGAGHRFVVDYFAQEVLSSQPEEVVSFLRRSSVLSVMSGSLCDAALQVSQSSALLAQIYERNLFLVPAEAGGWFRYHQLFAAILRAQLRRVEPDQEALIHSRAATWFEEHAMPARAIEHAVAVGGRPETAARLIGAHVQTLNTQGRLHQVRPYLSALDDDMMRAFPAGAVNAGWVWALTGRPGEAAHALRIAEQVDEHDGPFLDGSASLASAVARLRTALAVAGISNMVEEARAAVRLEPPGSPWHPMAGLLLGCALTLSGETRQATAAFASAVQYSTPNQRPGVSMALGQLALLAIDGEDWDAAAAYVYDALRLIEDGHLEPYLTSLVVYAAAARLRLHAADTLAAEEALSKAVQIYADPSPRAFPWLASQTAIVLGHLLVDLGHPDEAWKMLSDSKRFLHLLPTSGVLPARQAELQRRLPLSGPAIVPGEALSTTQLRVLRMLPTHKTVTTIAEELAVPSPTVKTQMKAIYRKLGVSNRAAALETAADQGLLQRDTTGAVIYRLAGRSPAERGTHDGDS
jgi:LuxR family maltose regulon positive regulatory protein